MIEITEKDLQEVPLDNVNHPSHYETGKIECIDVMLETQGEESVKAFCICNAMKYLYRHKKKNGREDIAKAKWYLEKYLELEEWGGINEDIYKPFQKRTRSRRYTEGKRKVIP